MGEVILQILLCLTSHSNIYMYSQTWPNGHLELPFTSTAAAVKGQLKTLPT